MGGREGGGGGGGGGHHLFLATRFYPSTMKYNDCDCGILKSTSRSLHNGQLME